MQPVGTLRPHRFLRCPFASLTEHVAPSRRCVLPGLPVGGRRALSSRGRKALSHATEDASQISAPPLPANADTASDHAQLQGEPPPPTAGATEAPAAAEENEQPAAAVIEGVEYDWLQPEPGDWGGVVDRQSIREPDSSGVLFFFILIAGLSIGVHQLIRLVGGRRADDQLARPVSAGAAAVVATPSWRHGPRPGVPPSKPEAVAEFSGPSSSPAELSGSRHEAKPIPSRTPGITADTQDQWEAPEQSTSLGDGGAGAGPSVEGQTEDAGAEGRLVLSESEAPGGEAAETNVVGTEAVGELTSALQQQQHQEQEQLAQSALPQQLPRTTASSSNSNRGLGGAGTASLERGVEAPAAPSLSAIKDTPSPAGSTDLAQQLPLQQPAQEQQWQGPPSVSGSLLGPEAGYQAEQPSEAGEASRGSAVAEPAEQLASTSSSIGWAGVTARLGVLSPPGRPIVPSEQPGPGPTSIAGAAGQIATPRVPSPIPSLGVYGLEGGVQPGPQPDAPAVAPTRVALPSVRPEPLSRAPDSSALAHLPQDDSLASLRERAKLALRAAAAASEASQRAAAYAAAASSAASRAAEAAERAAAAATTAQGGLESAAESAIAAAETRVAQAAEAAKEAEGRAASAAAHATAYQDMSQSQADIAERASNPLQPPAPGPLSQLQQLWRSASSAFTQGGNPTSHAHPSASPAAPQQQQRARQAVGSRTDEGYGAAGVAQAGRDCASNGGGPDGEGRSGGARGPGSAAAETIKGLFSWLGQGDDSR